MELEEIKESIAKLTKSSSGKSPTVRTEIGGPSRPGMDTSSASYSRSSRSSWSRSGGSCRMSIES
jgi:hypothetical protein